MQFNEKKSIYLQIADYMYDQILKGSWGDGERIPSIRDLAIQMEVNPNTVTRTYNSLQEVGIIFNKRGIGYFTAENAYELAIRQKKQEFISGILPEIFRTMKQLSITPDDVKNLYYEHMKGNVKNEDKQ